MVQVVARCWRCKLLSNMIPPNAKMQRSRRNNRRGRPRRRNNERLGGVRQFESNYFDLDNVPNSRIRFRDTIMPDRFYTRLNYDFNNYQLMASSSSGTLLIAGNSCFDPDKTGVGHQPLGFDQFVGFYNRYRVHKSSITVELINTTLSCHIVCTPTTTSIYPATVTDALESPYTMSMPISSSVFKMVKTRAISTKKIWGMQSITQDDLYQALYSADPARLWLWKIQSESFDGATSMSLRVNIKVAYEVEFFERAVITQSVNSLLKT